jgi:hypothetical protein
MLAARRAGIAQKMMQVRAATPAVNASTGQSMPSRLSHHHLSEEIEF